jgi:hypothetical protein
MKPPKVYVLLILFSISDGGFLVTNRSGDRAFIIAGSGPVLHLVNSYFQFIVA